VDLAELWGYPFPNWKHLIDFKTAYWEDILTLQWYNRHDLASTKWIDDRTQPWIEKLGLRPLQNLMSDFIRVMTEMEAEGMQVDMEAHAAFIKGHQETLDAKKVELKAYADIDWQSNPQVGEYYALQGIQLPRTGKDRDQVDKKALLKLEHPSAKILLDYRAAAKQSQTYGTGFLGVLVDGVYYPDYKLAGSSDGESKAPVTGRMSEKFIQIMPRGGTSEFKKCIISKFPEGILISCDWMQLEIALNAEIAYHVTGIRNLMDDLLSGADLHTETLKRFPVLPNRTRAKNVNFSVFFGGRGYTLTHEYGLSSQQAIEIRHDLLDVRYPEMGGYFDSCERQLLRQGFVVCPYTGKRRFTSSVTEAYNDKIQHLGTVFNKIMMVKTWDVLERAGFRARPIAEIHDDITYDCPKEEYEELVPILKHEYSQISTYFKEYFGRNLVYPFKADMKAGPNLFEQKKVEEVA